MRMKLYKAISVLTGLTKQVVSSVTNGYFAGGATTTLVTDKVSFITDLITQVSSVINTYREYPGAICATLKGYVCAGRYGINTINAFTYATELFSVLSNALTNIGNAKGSGCNSNTTGYYFSSTTVNSLNLTSEATTLLSTVLTVSMASGAGVSSADNGYTGGVDNNGLLNKFTFFYRN